MKSAEREYMGRVAELCCIACKRIGYSDTPAEVHHVRFNVGMGQRASNYDTIPLCPHHHRHGSDAIHRSKKSFEESYGTEQELLAEVQYALGYKAALSERGLEGPPI